MRTSLDLHAAQQIALTPQAMQAIHLLQLSAADLEHEIEEALAHNPLLVREEPVEDSSGGAPAEQPAPGETTANEAVAEEQTANSAEGDGADDARNDDPWVGTARRTLDGVPAVAETRAAPTSLRDHLHEQLAGSRLQPVERALVEMVIEGLDDDGYLRQSVDELLQTVPPELQARADQVEMAIRFVQSLDPAGVGARSLAECLALQLERRTPDSEADAQLHALALRIVREHLESLALHDALKLAQELACDDEAIRRANLLIRSLNPRPGAAYADVQTRYVVADVIVRKVDGRWVATVNPQAVPHLKVDRILAEALQRDRAARSQFAQHLREARALIHNVQQRFVTIQRVAQAIVDRQRLYFELGELALRPLALRDVARTLRLHPSTVSRVCSNKYARTPAGVIELKRFFSPRASHANEGIDCSSAAIRALVSELIAAEDPRDPLSDVQLTRQLASRGIHVARRTVAKHRAALGIPAVESRRMSVEGGPVRRPKSARPIAALAFERRGRRAAAQDSGGSPVASAPYSFKRL